MRSTLAVLAALAAATGSLAAVPTFDKADCGSMSSNAYEADVAGVNNGAWSCVSFSVGLDSQQLVKLTMAPRWQGWVLQGMLWNDGQVAGAASSNTWADTTAGRGTLELIRSQNGQKDIEGLPAAHSSVYNNLTSPVSLNTVNGWTGDVAGFRNAGVYAYVFASDVTLNPGLNTFVISNPDAAAPGGTFGGVFMWRLVNTAVPDNLYTMDGPLSESAVYAHFGAVGANKPVTINNVLLPGADVNTFTLRISDAWAVRGEALQGFGYTLGVNPGGSSADATTTEMDWADRLPFPNGYGTNDGWEKSFTDGNPGLGVQDTIKSTNFARTTDNQGLWFDYSSGTGAMSTHNGSQTLGTNEITFTVANYPIDVTDNGASSFGALTISVPNIQNSVDSTERPYDWTGQSSPFWDVTITLGTVTQYPMLGSESNVELFNKNSNPADGHGPSEITTDQDLPPFKIYRVSTSDPLWWRMIVNLNSVSDINLPTGVTSQTGCAPRWEYQIIQDADNGHYENGWAQGWNSVDNPESGYDGEDFWANNADARAQKVETANAWVTNEQWRVNGRLPSNARDTLLPYLKTSRSTWMLIRVSATKPETMGGTKTCGSNHVTVGSMSASWDTIADQCRDYRDCLVATADNPNADQDGDSANRNARRFSSCWLWERPGSNYRWIPTTKCMECYNNWQCGEGQYCHLDKAMSTFTWGSYSAVYTVDPDSQKLYGTCQQKSNDVLGQRCRPLTFGSTRANSYFAAVGSSSGVSVAGGAALPGGAASSPNLLTVAYEGDAENADYAEGAYGACGEFRFGGARRPDDATLPDQTPEFINGDDVVRTALWVGFCDSDQICRECIPGNSFTNSGKVCLNGRSFSAMDVDNTVRSFGQNTVASTELGTTSMVIILIILFASYMYTEAKRHRSANGLPPMTCLECLCCCGCCAKEGGAAASAGSSAKTTPEPAQAAPTA